MKVIKLSDFRKNKTYDEQINHWDRIFSQVDKMELLEHMVRFQEDRQRHVGLTEEMVCRGVPLFEQLKATAETEELYILCNSYHKHLLSELAELKKAK